MDSPTVAPKSTVRFAVDKILDLTYCNPNYNDLDDIRSNVFDATCGGLSFGCFETDEIEGEGKGLVPPKHASAVVSESSSDNDGISSRDGCISSPVVVNPAYHNNLTCKDINFTMKENNGFQEVVTLNTELKDAYHLSQNQSYYPFAKQNEGETGIMNEFHCLAFHAEWDALRKKSNVAANILEHRSSKIKKLPLLSQINDEGHTPLMVALVRHGRKVPFDIVHFLLDLPPQTAATTSMKSCETDMNKHHNGFSLYEELYPVDGCNTGCRIDDVDFVASIYVKQNCFRSGIINNIHSNNTIHSTIKKRRFKNGGSDAIKKKNGAGSSVGRLYPLHVAASSGCSFDVISLLYHAYPMAIEASDGRGNLPLHLAINNLCFQKTPKNMCNSLLDGGESFELDGDIDEKNGFYENHKNNRKGGKNIDFNYTIWLEQVCQLFLHESKCSTIHQNFMGQTPLMLALYRRAPDFILSLLMKLPSDDLGINVESCSSPSPSLSPLLIPDFSGSYPLHYCDHVADINTIRKMSKSHPEVIGMQNIYDGETPLYVAMQSTSTKSVEILSILLDHCPSPKKAIIHFKNKQFLNLVEYGWKSLTTPRLVAAEDQGDEDKRLESNLRLLEVAKRFEDIRNSFVEQWWEKTMLVLEAVYCDGEIHENTNKKEDYTYSRLHDRIERRILRRPLHAALTIDCPNEMLSYILQLFPEEVENVDCNNNNPLHIALAHPHIVGDEVVALLINTNSTMAMKQNCFGCLPLHIACLHKASLGILRSVLDVYPDAVCIRNNNGQTPLFLAIIAGSSMDVLHLLLEVRPAAVQICDVHGVSPVAVAWHLLVSAREMNGKHEEQSRKNSGLLSKTELMNRAQSNIFALASAMSSTSLTGEVKKWLQKIDFLLRVSFYGHTVNNTRHAHNDDFLSRDTRRMQWRAVHASAMQGSCPPGVLAFALQILPDEAKVRNEDGNLPIHIVSKARQIENVPNQLSSGDAIRIVISSYNDGVRRMDSKGRLALHLALDNGISWSSGVKDLVEAFPESVRVRDIDTFLFPFMLAGCKPKTIATQEWTEKDEEIDLAITSTTYNLLRLAPDLIWGQNGFAETMYLRRVRQELLAERKGFQKRLACIEAESLKLMTVTELQHFEEKKRREKISTREKQCEENAMKIQRESNKMDSVLDDIERSLIQIRAGIR